jgi:hypothetical protein
MEFDMAETWTQGDESRGILFGTVGLQLDLVDAPQLMEACESWNRARQVALADWIAQRARIPPDGRGEIERAMTRKVARFRGDLRAATREMLSGHAQRTLRAVRNPELAPLLAGLVQGSDDRSTGQRQTDRWGEPVADLADRPAEGLDGEGGARQFDGWQGWIRRHRALVNWTVSVALVAVLCLAAGMALLNDNNQKLFGQRPFVPNGGNFPPAAWVNGQNLPQIVTGLYLTLGSKEAVVDHLKRDQALTEPERRIAVELAEGTEYAMVLNNASWYLARQPGLDAATYERAQKLAEGACRMVPGDSNILNTLGVAQYRRGAYAEALKTLQRSEPGNTGKSGPHPADLAFLAMTQFKLGHKEQAQGELKRLRQALAVAPWQMDPEARAFLHEAEDLLQVPLTTFPEIQRRKIHPTLPRRAVQ